MNLIIIKLREEDLLTCQSFTSPAHLRKNILVYPYPGGEQTPPEEDESLNCWGLMKAAVWGRGYLSTPDGNWYTCAGRGAQRTSCCSTGYSLYISLMTQPVGFNLYELFPIPVLWCMQIWIISLHCTYFLSINWKIVNFVSLSVIMIWIAF